MNQNPSSWPEQAKVLDNDDIVLMTTPTEMVIDWSRFSNYQKMINVVVYSLRFESKHRGFVTALENQIPELWGSKTTKLVVIQTGWQQWSEK